MKKNKLVKEDAMDMGKFLVVESWLPVFPGFYNTSFETSDEDYKEIANDINAIRKQNDLIGKIDDDLIDYDYTKYKNDYASNLVDTVEVMLQEQGLVKKVMFTKLVSPKEYNFANDSIDVDIHLEPANIEKIKSMLDQYSEEFAEYIKETYKSRSGFIPGYSDDSDEWLVDDAFLTHRHMLGTVLEFLLLTTADNMIELEERLLYDTETPYLGSGEYIKNYEELTTEDYDERNKTFGEVETIKAEEEFGKEYTRVEEYDDVKKVMFKALITGYSPANDVYVKYDDGGDIEEVWYPTEEKDEEYMYKLIFPVEN